MKSKYFSFLFLAISILFVNNTRGQDDKSNFEPVYITVRTLHGVEGSDLEEWRAVEEEYFDKVINKIDLLLSHEVLINYFDNNLSEVKIINVFNKWDDIEKIYNIRDDLIEKAWPNEDERKAFFEKQNSFYSNFHSDEIYTSTEFGKYLSPEIKKVRKESFVFFEKTSILSDYEDDDSYKYYEEYVENVIFKNPLIRAYHPYRHFWGADSREFIEMLVVDSMEDLEAVLKTNQDLLDKMVPDPLKRKEFLKIFEKAIEGQSTAIYKNIPSLSK